MKKVKYAIIGAGTAGLTARREIARETDDYVLIDPGPLGTTCAREGCMPSKVFIQVANDFHRRHKFDQLGILGQESLNIDSKKVMQHVRKLRDGFTNPILKSMDHLSEQTKLVRKKARFIDAHTLDLGDEKIQAEKIIIATGSSPLIPAPWKEFGDKVISTTQFFELEELPKSVAVIGLGVIGLEIGQALARLGVKVTGIAANPNLGGSDHPEVQETIKNVIESEMELIFERAEIKEVDSDNQLVVQAGSQKIKVDKALVSIGRRPNLESLGLKELGVEMDERGVPLFKHDSLCLKDHPHLFIAGDVNAFRPLLHEASDQGFIAAQGALDPKNCFQMRTPLAITFCSPNIASCGKKYSDLKNAKIPFIEGSVSFEKQGRAKAMVKNQGVLKLFASPDDGKLLGAEICAPEGEHIAHLLSWSIAQNLSVLEMLRMPFYHPVLEEGLRTALRDVAKQLELSERPLDLSRCPNPSAGC